MRRIYLNILRGLSVNWFGKVGVILSTSTFLTFIFLEILSFMGIYTNAYMGLITYLLFPSLFVFGLILIPIGWFKYLKITGKKTLEILIEKVGKEESAPRLFGSRVFLLLMGLSGINVIFMLGASARALHFMESSEFCGTACHGIMNPEYIAYQVSPHANVSCVSCHVGDGIQALIETKMSGARMMIKATLNTYSRPIPTPVHNLRPARETCEKCHWPDKFYGSRLKQIIRYDQNETNTPLYTTLNIKVDSYEKVRSGVHWHIEDQNEIRYASVDDKREDIKWVEVKQEDGSWKRYENRRLKYLQHEEDIVKTMDCVDCHNRPAHTFQDPAHAIDEALTKGLINSELPFIKREGLAALSMSYQSKSKGKEFIDRRLVGFYQENYPSADQTQISIASQVLQTIFDRNIHPQMGIEWGTYPNHIGHTTSPGCFRCHNENMVDGKGIQVSDDCTLCHSILANDELVPFKYLLPADTSDINFDMHRYLQDEFINSFRFKPVIQ